MSIKELSCDGVVTLSISDEMTIYTAAEYKQKLFASLEQADELELDLSEVSEIDSAGTQILMLLKHEGELREKLVRYLNHSQPVLNVMELLNLTSRFADPVVLSAQTGGSPC